MPIFKTLFYAPQKQVPCQCWGGTQPLLHILSYHISKRVELCQLILGEVVRVHVATDIWVEGRIDPALLNPVTRLAGSEFAFMGEVPPRERRPEGPFGDHYGYYSLTHDYPVFKVTQLRFDHQPAEAQLVLPANATD